jgi:exonuclease III
MKIAFWNMGGMGATSDKLAVANNWYKSCNPDIFVMEEVSHTLVLSAVSAGSTGTCKYASAPVDDKDGKQTTKNLAVIYKDTIALDPTSKALPNQRATANDRASSGLLPSTPQRRQCIHFSCQVGGIKHDFYGLHGNASSSGGNTAFDCMEAAIDTSTVKTVAGGDFNSTKTPDTSGVKKILGKAHDGTDLNFTQWAKHEKPAKFSSAQFDFNAQAYADYLVSIHLPANHAGQGRWTKSVDAHNIIDYVLCSSGVTIVAESNCKDAEEWFEILKEFDHCPVVYKIT